MTLVFDPLRRKDAYVGASDTTTCSSLRRKTRSEEFGGWRMTAWPEGFDQLVRELRAGRGRPALIDGMSPHAASTVARLAERLGRVSLGQLIATAATAPSAADLFAALDDRPTLLVDIEVLFTPAMAVEVLPQLRRESQRRPLIVLWPGQIGVTRLSYSLPGRVDHLDEPARDLVVLRPVLTEFPDETPYELERFPA